MAGDPTAAGSPRVLPARVPGWLPHFLLLADSACPVGAFSHSWGLETLLARGARGVETVLRLWLASEWAGVEAPAFAAAHRAAARGAAGQLLQLDRRADALRLPREWREGGRRVGRRLLVLARTLLQEEGAGPGAGGAWPPRRGRATRALERLAAEAAAGSTPGQHPVAAGAVFAAFGVPLPWALTAFLGSSVQGLVAAAVRLAPLGQLEAQRLAARLLREGAPLAGWALEARDPDLERAGGFAPVLEIAGMQHEALAARLFLS